MHRLIVVVLFTDLLFCLDSLDIIRKIEDQACPYFKYYPIEASYSRVDDIVLDDRPDNQRISDFTGSFSNFRLLYQFKPYR